MIERISMTWNTASSRVASRPATAMTSISVSQPAIHAAALVVDWGACIGGRWQSAL